MITLEALNDKIDLVSQMQEISSKKEGLHSELIDSLFKMSDSLKNMYMDMADKMELIQNHIFLVNDTLECRMTILENTTNSLITQMAKFLTADQHDGLIMSLTGNFEETIQTLLKDKSLSEKVKEKIRTLTPADYLFKKV